MNLHIKDFITKKNLCLDHGGNNISPCVTWNSVKDAQSYSLILEDPDTPHGTMVHWYIPYISNKINSISCLDMNINKISLSEIYNKINYNNILCVMGKNTINEYSYHGICNPEFKIHRYIFTIFALHSIFKINIDNEKIIDSNDFRNKLNRNGIKIISEDSRLFTYSKK